MRGSVRALASQQVSGWGQPRRDAPQMLAGYINSTTASSHTLPLPSGWQQGDLAVIATGFGSARTCNTLSGWTRQGTDVTGATVTQAMRFAVMTRVLQSGDGSAVVAFDAAANASSQLYVIRGGVIVGFSNISNSGGASTTLTIPETASPGTGLVLDLYGWMKSGVGVATIARGLLPTDVTTTGTDSWCRTRATASWSTGSTDPSNTVTLAANHSLAMARLIIKSV